MNRLSLERRTQIIGALVEGNSIRSTERMTDTHRDTVMRLLVQVGEGSAKLMDEQMRELSCQRLQVDEIWSYVQKKQRQVTPDDDRSRVGDMWTFVAIDPDTKLIPAYRVGKRTRPHAVAFMGDLSERLANRVQLSSDALSTYVDAVERAFGADVDYGQAVKFYEAEPIGPGRYSPPRVVRSERTVINGNPDEPDRTPEPHHADEHAPVHPPDKRVQQEDREHEGGGFAALCALQFRPHSPDVARHPSHGGGGE
jgi:IS1 family transposase